MKPKETVVWWIEQEKPNWVGLVAIAVVIVAAIVGTWRCSPYGLDGRVGALEKKMEALEVKNEND